MSAAYLTSKVEPRYDEGPKTGKTCFAISRLFSIYFTIAETKNIRYTEDLVIWRFVEASFHSEMAYNRYSVNQSECSMELIHHWRLRINLEAHGKLVTYIFKYFCKINSRFYNFILISFSESSLRHALFI